MLAFEEILKHSLISICDIQLVREGKKLKTNINSTMDFVLPA